MRPLIEPWGDREKVKLLTRALPCVRYPMCPCDHVRRCQTRKPRARANAQGTLDLRFAMTLMMHPHPMGNTLVAAMQGISANLMLTEEC